MSDQQKLHYYCSPRFISKIYGKKMKEFEADKSLEWKLLSNKNDAFIEKLAHPIFIIRRTTVTIDAPFELVK